MTPLRCPVPCAQCMTAITGSSLDAKARVRIFSVWIASMRVIFLVDHVHIEPTQLRLFGHLRDSVQAGQA